MQTEYLVKTIRAVLDLSRSPFYHTALAPEDAHLPAARLHLVGH
jgi:hypothetical protein